METSTVTALQSAETYLYLAFALGMAPFLAVMTTSFVKLAVVFSLLRNALGIQQIPPNLAIYGLSVILTLYIMAPVFDGIWQEKSRLGIDVGSPGNVIQNIDALGRPYLEFLKDNTQKSELDFFLNTAKIHWPKESFGDLNEENYLILIPAFTVTQLTEAFQIGFLLYLPFIVIDLIVSNILLAMGMMMVSPMTISLPFKLLLFVLADGWVRLVHGLVLTYV